jgi:hypothetical protein
LGLINACGFYTVAQKYEKPVVIKEVDGVAAHEYTPTSQRWGILNVKKKTYSIDVSADMTNREITCNGPGFSTQVGPI